MQIPTKSLPAFQLLELRGTVFQAGFSLFLPGIRERDIEPVYCVELDSHQEPDFKSLPRTTKTKSKEPVRGRGSGKAAIREKPREIDSGAERLSGYTLAFGPTGPQVHC